MKKVKIGTIKHKVLVQGDVNLLEPNEILVTQSEEHILLRERMLSGQIKTSVVIPLEEITDKRESKSKSNGKSETNGA